MRRTLAGDAAQLEEYTVGVEVFARGADFDPKLDGIVRVNAGHPRKKLAAYHADEGAADPVVIDVPKGGYVPTFTRRAALPYATVGAARTTPRRWP